MTERTAELRKEAADLRRLAELPANAPIRDRMLALAKKYEELADQRQEIAALKKRDAPR